MLLIGPVRMAATPLNFFFYFENKERATIEKRHRFSSNMLFNELAGCDGQWNYLLIQENGI